MQGSERRRMQRRRMLFNLEVYGRDDGALMGHLGDLHGRGLAILRSVDAPPLAVGAELALAITTPELGEESARQLDLDVVVRWSRPDANRTLVGVGCEIVAPSRSLAAAITHLVERFEFAV